MSIQSVSNGSYTNMHNLKESSDINKYWKKNCIGVASKLFINGKSLSEVFKSEFSELKRLDAEADKSDCEEKEGVNPAAQARFAKCCTDSCDGACGDIGCNDGSTSACEACIGNQLAA